MLSSNVELKNGMWIGHIKLNTWNHFFDIAENIDLNIGGDQNTKCIKQLHETTYRYLLENEEKILEDILNDLMLNYATLQQQYGYDAEELEEYMPSVNCIEDFKNMLSPRRIYILNVKKDGIAYVGFQFWCMWDEEHGYGVMMHKERIVKIGGVETAFLSWIAEEDKKNQSEFR